MERIVGVNEIRFFVTDDMKPTRKNIVLHSKQFDALLKSKKRDITTEDIMFWIPKFLDENKDSLTDVRTEVVGYY